MNTTQDTSARDAPAATGRWERSLTVLACIALVAIAGMLWASNGMAVFSEMMLGLWALCF